MVLNSLFSRKQPEKPTPEQPPPEPTWSERLGISRTLDEAFHTTQEYLDQVTANTRVPSTREATFAAVGALSWALIGTAYSRYFKRIPTSAWLTPDHFAGKRRRWIKGRVVSVGDADNFRLYHTPGFGWGFFRHVPETAKELRRQTLHIRLAGVDAPEGAHFGKEAQEHYPESLQWLREQVLGKTVHCELYSRDQYMRVVAMPYLKRPMIPRMFSKGTCVSTEMLRAGWAVVYEQGGAQYGSHTVEEFREIEEKARSAKRGIWVSGFLKETPSAYKKRIASDADAAEKGESADVAPEEEAPGLFGRLFSARR